MIFIWLFYLALSMALGFLMSLMVKNKYAKILIFSFIISITSTVWFKSPGENILVPIFSIFLLESTILEDNGISRILRPFIFIFFVSLITSYFFWKDNFKN